MKHTKSHRVQPGLTFMFPQFSEQRVTIRFAGDDLRLTDDNGESLNMKITRRSNDGYEIEVTLRLEPTPATPESIDECLSELGTIEESLR